MRTALTLLDGIQIASPCPARWEGMAGDDRARHCGSCDRTVYDLSGLTAAEAEALIHEHDGRLCVRLFRRADGRVLTADCPEGLRARLQRWRKGTSGLAGWLLALVVCALLEGLVFLLGAERQQE